jgi:hypothetical protein
MISERADGGIVLIRQGAIFRRKQQEFESLNLSEHREIARVHATPNSELL